jgi:hypothetical protein
MSWYAWIVTIVVMAACGGFVIIALEEEDSKSGKKSFRCSHNKEGGCSRD